MSPASVLSSGVTIGRAVHAGPALWGPKICPTLFLKKVFWGKRGPFWNTCTRAHCNLVTPLVLRHYMSSECCMCDQALQAIYQSVVLAKLLYASSAWWGFTTADDRQPLNLSSVKEFGLACIRYTGQPQHSSWWTQMVHFVQPTTEQWTPYSAQTSSQTNWWYNYQLRPRSRNISLSSDMDQRDFIIRLAFKDID